MSGDARPAAAAPDRGATRRDRGRTPALADGDPIVLYDGWCNLCDSSVAFILRRDRAARFRFAALQSATGQAILSGCGSGERFDGTMVLVHDGRCRTRSQALLTILGLLPPPWPWLTVFTVVPRRARDWGYDTIARHRTKWFGRTRICMTSLSGYQDRFLD